MAMTPQHILKYLISSAQIWKKAFSSNAEIVSGFLFFKRRKIINMVMNQKWSRTTTFSSNIKKFNQTL